MELVAQSDVKRVSPSRGERVLQESVRVWRTHGEWCEVVPGAAPGVLASITAPDARVTEFVIDDDDDVARSLTWRALEACPKLSEWQARALVPRSLLGQAHEALRPFGFVLQGWWIDEETDRVSFGAEEIA